MIKNTMLNIYQNNPEKGVEFWKKYLGFKEVSRFEFGGTTAYVLSMGGSYSVTIFDKNEIKKLAPEVADNFPSILFTVDNIDELHEKLTADGQFASEIVPRGDQRTFYFNDGDDNYYAVIS